MAYGPGKYDDVCTKVRQDNEAEGAIVIILNGNKGSGFSCQASEEFTSGLASMLEDMAKQIRQSAN